MKKLTYLFLISGLILTSCAKEKLAREPDPQNPFVNEIETARIDLSGYSQVTGRSFQADIFLYDQLKSYVTITDADETLALITEKAESFDISDVTIQEMNSGSYLLDNVLNTNPKVVLSGLNSLEKTLTGDLAMDDTNVKISFSSELFSDNTIQNGKLPLDRDGFSRSAPIIPLIAAGIAVTTTAVQCAYERTAARISCTKQYDKCLIHCNNCLYDYDAGYCGGDCLVDCKY